MGWAAAAGAGMGLVSAYMASRASGRMASAIKKAIKLQKEMYRTGRADLAPYKEIGKEFLPILAEMVKAGPGEFKESPGYQFRVGEGVKALERGAAAKGKQLSGEQQKALLEFGQQAGSAEYQNFLDRYYTSLVPVAGMVELGQSAAAQTASMGVSSGANIAQTYQQLGQARAQQLQPWAQFAGTMGQNLLDYGSIYGGQSGGSSQSLTANQSGYTYSGPYQYGR